MSRCIQLSCYFRDLCATRNSNMFEYMCFFKANIRTSFLSNFDSPNTHSHTHTNRHTHKETHKQKHTHNQTQRDTHTQTHTHKQTCTHRHTQTNKQTQTNWQTYRSFSSLQFGFTRPVDSSFT